MLMDGTDEADARTQSWMMRWIGILVRAGKSEIGRFKCQCPKEIMKWVRRAQGEDD